MKKKKLKKRIKLLERELYYYRFIEPTKRVLGECVPFDTLLEKLRKEKDELNP